MTRQIVTKTATCKRCNSTTVAWNQSDKGKWYLSEVFTYDEGTDYETLKSDHRDFHSNYCGKPEAHEKEQTEIKQDELQEIARREAAEEKSAADTAAYFLALHDLCKTKPIDAMRKLAELERKVAFETANWVSMDYMTDAMRQRAEVKRMKTEISFMQAALGITRYED